MPTKRPTSPEILESRRQRHAEQAADLFTCRKCGEQKTGSEFYFDSSRTDGIDNKCKACAKEAFRTYRKSSDKSKRVYERKQMQAKAIRDVLYTKGCVICGEIEPCCLHLHHLDPSTKERNFSDLVLRGKTGILKKELEKGVAVLCANCHAKVHAGILSLSQ